MRLILPFLLFTFLSAQSQKLYMPRDIQRAFSKGTRSANGNSQQWNNSPQYYTNVPVRLRPALAAHDSTRIFIRWHYDMSLESGREGMIDSTTFFLAYFYPRVAVYDDYQGWDN